MGSHTPGRIFSFSDRILRTGIGAAERLDHFRRSFAEKVKLILADAFA